LWAPRCCGATAPYRSILIDFVDGVDYTYVSFFREELMSKFRLAFVSLVLFGLASGVRADVISDHFQANMAQEPLDAFAKDMGALVGGGSFHDGRALGFPVGFDVGVHVPVVGLQDKDAILRGAGDSKFPAVWGQAEVGLPFNFNVIARGGKVLDANMLGGGLRYGILKPSVPGIPSLSIEGLYGRLTHDFFDGDVYTANAVLSFDVPFIRPYVGGGYDYTKIKPTSRAFNGVPASVPRNLEGTSNGYRAEVGINLSVIPFTYIDLGLGLANGKSLYHAGLGAHF
jgi:hypothetical protein